MISDYSFNQDFDSDDEDLENKFVYDGKDIVIFVIDVANSMFSKTLNDENNELRSPFDVCLSTLDKVFREKVRRSAKDLNGIVFYNTEKSPDQKDVTDLSIVTPANCAVFIPLQKIESDVIRYLRNTKDSGDYNDFANKYGHSSNAKISDVLWLCRSLISHCGHKVHSCTIFWLTNQDSPHETNSVAFNEAMQQAKDLQYLQLYFELCPLNNKFVISLFYEKLMENIMNTDIQGIDLNYTLDETTLMYKLLIHDNRCRALSYLTVEISEKAKFGVGIYSELSKSKEPKPILIDRKTKLMIRSHRTFKYAKLPIDNDDVDNNEGGDYNFEYKLNADKAAKYLEIGNRKVQFTPLEVYEMKQLMQPKVKVLGFKPFEAFNPLHHKRSGYFVHPTDRHIKDSTKMFRTLWQTCLDMKKIVLCAFSMRLKSYQQLCFLIPQRENESLETSDGFQLEFIPYSEEIRNVDKHLLKDANVDSDINELVRKILTNLTFKYDPNVFKNPITSTIFDKLEEIEFDEEPKNFDNHTEPNIDVQDARIRSCVQALCEKLDGFTECTKRKNSTKKEDGPVKKVALDVNYEMIFELCQKNKTKNLNVEMLKEYLKWKNVTGLSKLKKEELIAKVVANPL